MQVTWIGFCKILLDLSEDRFFAVNVVWERYAEMWHPATVL